MRKSSAPFDCTYLSLVFCKLSLNQLLLPLICAFFFVRRPFLIEICALPCLSFALQSSRPLPSLCIHFPDLCFAVSITGFLSLCFPSPKDKNLYVKSNDCTCMFNYSMLKVIFSDKWALSSYNNESFLFFQLSGKTFSKERNSQDMMKTKKST